MDRSRSIAVLALVTALIAHALLASATGGAELLGGLALVLHTRHA